MFYVTFGQKKNMAIIFLHGWGGSSASWLGTAKMMANLGFYSVVVDFSGFGKSAEPKTPFGVEDYMNEVVALIKSLNLTHVYLVGHSFGGRVAIMLTASKKLKVDKLVLVDSAGVLPRRGFIYKIKVKKYKRLKKKVECGKCGAEELNGYGSSDYVGLSPIMKQTFIKVVNQDLVPYAKNISTETLIVWGKKDKDTPMYMAKKLQKAITGSSLVVLPSGHYCYIDNFKDFIDELYAFLIC